MEEKDKKEYIANELNKAIQYHQAGNLSEAKEYYLKILDLEKNALVYNNLAIISIQQGNFNEAIELVKKAIEVNPTWVGAFFTLGNLYLDIGDLDSSIINFQEVIELEPGFIEAYLNLGNIYQKIGDSNQAKINYKKIIELQPNFSQAYNYLG